MQLRSTPIFQPGSVAASNATPDTLTRAILRQRDSTASGGR